MSVWAGIDLGTSGIKLALFDDDERLMASASRAIAVSRPRPGWSEQHPDLWWQAVCSCFDELAGTAPEAMAGLRGIGLSGQMLGLVLLDEAQLPVRPAILWNDQRALAECRELLERVPDIGRRSHGAPDPGIIGPKMLWLATHEPDALEKARLILLPKDHVRLKLTGTVATEPSDANGTMMMDCVSRQWDPELCRALDWDMDRLPPIAESWAEAGQLRASLCRRWKTPAHVPVAAGAGDNMACTIGVGAARPGDVVITVGTSGVVNAVDRDFHPAPQSAVLTAPHAAPDTFLSQGVVMSATASLDWLARLTGTGAPQLAQEAACFARGQDINSAPLMRPSLSGIRTPDNRPDAGGMLDGITQVTGRAALAYALLEGVAFQFARCISAQKQAGVPFATLQLVGGGSRSRFWAGLIASVLEQPLCIPEGAARAANRGAARLARIAAGEATTALLATRQPAARAIPVNEAWLDILRERRVHWQNLPVNSAGGITGTARPA